MRNSKKKFEIRSSYFRDFTVLQIKINLWISRKMWKISSPYDIWCNLMPFKQIQGIYNELSPVHNSLGIVIIATPIKWKLTRKYGKWVIRIVYCHKKSVVEGKWCWAGRKEIKPLGQPGQYDSFPSTSLLLPFFNDNELSYSTIENIRRSIIFFIRQVMANKNISFIWWKTNFHAEKFLCKKE